MSLLGRAGKDHGSFVGEALREAEAAAERGEVAVGCLTK